MFVLLLLLAGTATFLSAWNGAGHRRDDEMATATALQLAKEAVLGWSAGHATHPGLLPCPQDPALLGTANEGQALAACNAVAPVSGPLAWRTLKSGVLRDHSGAPLWVVLSPGFRNAPINTTSVGQLSLDGNANAAVALIIAPGPPLAGQNRSLPSAANPPAAADWLDLGNAGGVAFVTSGPAGGFNDRVLPVTLADWSAPLIRRVFGELIGEAAVGGLRRYYNDHGEFPWADTSADGAAEPGQPTGSLPYKEMIFDAATLGWLTANGWFPLTGYTRIGETDALLTLGGKTAKVTP